MTIPPGSTFYSKHSSVGDFVFIDGENDLAADMIEIMANINMLEGFAGYPLTTWANPVDEYSKFLTLRVIMSGGDIPGGGLLVTDAINRMRVQVLGIPSVISWGFTPNRVSEHIIARDSMQAHLGAPMHRSDGSGVEISEFINDEDGNPISSAWGEGGPVSGLTVSGPPHWNHIWPIFYITAPNDIGDVSYFAFQRNTQLIISHWRETIPPTQSPDTIEIRTADSSGLAAPLDLLSFYNTSTYTGQSYQATPFTAFQEADISISISSWLLDGLPANDLVTFWASTPVPRIGLVPGPFQIYHIWTPAFPEPESKVFFWGIDT